MNYSTLLFAGPSFLEGCARVMDFSGLLDSYNSYQSAELADYLAIASDWNAVGEDLRNAVDSKLPGDLP